MTERDSPPGLVEVGIAALKILLPVAVTLSLMLCDWTGTAVQSAASSAEEWAYTVIVVIGWITAFATLPRTRWKAVATIDGVKALFRLVGIALPLAVLGLIAADRGCGRIDGVEQQLACRLYSESLVLAWCVPVSAAAVWFTHLAKCRASRRHHGHS